MEYCIDVGRMDIIQQIVSEAGGEVLRRQRHKENYNSI